VKAHLSSESALTLLLDHRGLALFRFLGFALGPLAALIAIVANFAPIGADQGAGDKSAVARLAPLTHPLAELRYRPPSVQGISVIPRF
jgi:hypothetical protein